LDGLLNDARDFWRPPIHGGLFNADSRKNMPRIKNRPEDRLESKRRSALIGNTALAYWFSFTATE
jgi:hypothetical protein